ncbi:unnamed protein product [Dracunculus medinensis]|uniref:Uncharacterized protein n=1 Tax=Dracunculus medinensis TaxID=318479 RepID=A0A3P7SV12_DRAME|nr:unnamed protein product [Dracunculus medinensis]
MPPPMDTPVTLHNLMLRCWHIDRHKRPTFAQILQILEEYIRHPDLIYITESIHNGINNSEICSFNSSMYSSTSATLLRNGIPTLPTIVSPTASLDEFLRHIGLTHCLAKFYKIGIHNVSDLMHLSQVDFLNYGLMLDEAQRILDALNRPMTTLQRANDMPEPCFIQPSKHPSVYSPRMIDSSPTFGGKIKSGFFV